MYEAIGLIAEHGDTGYIPVIPATSEGRQEDPEFKVILQRPAWVRDPA